MRTWKWALLVMSGGVMVAVSGCSSTLLAFAANAVGRLVLNQILDSLTGTTA